MFKVGHQRMCGVRMHKIDVVIMTPFGRIGFVVNPELHQPYSCIMHVG